LGFLVAGLVLRLFRKPGMSAGCVGRVGSSAEELSVEALDSGVSNSNSAECDGDGIVPCSSSRGLLSLIGAGVEARAILLIEVCELEARVLVLCYYLLFIRP